MSETEHFLSGLSALKLTRLARDLRSRSAAVLQADPIAVIGMACRVPGASSPDEFWTLLEDKQDVTRPIPAERWDGESWYDAEISTPGKSVTRRGGFLDQIDQFDADFFGILPREADAMDPQQRVFLECAIETLDDAGQKLPDLRGSRTGVFVASYHSDYQALAYEDISAVDLRTLTGSIHSVVPNRLSHLLDLRGPSISIDTACSSSLVALHMACQSLRLGESDLALSGGVSLMVTPELMVSLSKVGFMAPDGRSKAFDAAADGFGRGEGCGVLALKRLSDAIADGDRVHAVIRGSMVNQDGESTLLTAPNGPAQEALIHDALEAAQVPPETINFVEAHGTGTELGDPIEVEAIARTVGRKTAGALPCYLGTCKANLGHLEAAAGVVGVIKTVLALKHRAIPGQPNFETLSPHISLKDTRLTIPRELTQLPQDTPLRAGVSGFGIGGTNAHVVLESAPDLGASDQPQETGPAILPLTAQSAEALQSNAANWVGFLEDTQENLPDICFTASQRRTLYPYRTAVYGRSKAELAERLQQKVQSGVFSAAQAPVPLGFVFCGQGALWVGMGRELLQSDAAFRQGIAFCDAALQPYWDTSLLDELQRPEDTSRLDRTEYAQPVLFGVQIALTRMWQARGIVPQAVVGHSVGEISALTVAGALSIETGARIVCHRARVMQRADGFGAMASVEMSQTEAQEFLDLAPNDLSIAAINAPGTCVFSGTPQAIDRLETAVAERGKSIHRLPVRYAFHNPQMDELLPQFRSELTDVVSRPADIPVYSTVTGGKLSGPVDLNHLCDNIRKPVRFADAISAMSGDGIAGFVEIGPHPVLSAAISGSAPSETGSPVASLRRGQNADDTVAAATAMLFERGISPDWTQVGTLGQVVSLPAYGWNRRRHWLPVSGTQQTSSVAEAWLHPLLSSHRHIAAQNTDLLEGDATGAWELLSQHRVFGQVVMPGAAMLEALAVAAHIAFETPVRIQDFTITAPLVLDDVSVVKWQILIVRSSDTAGTMTWNSWDGQTWTESATARIAPNGSAEGARAEIDWSAAAELTDTQGYSRAGLDLDRAFQCLRTVALTDTAARAELDEVDGSDGFTLSPSVLDAGFQLASVLADRKVHDTGSAPSLPIGVKTCRLLQQGAHPVSIEARLVSRSDTSFVADVLFFDADGALCAEIEQAAFVQADKSGALGTVRLGPYVETWEDIPEADATAPADANWLIVTLGPESDIATAAARTLKDSGASVRHLRCAGDTVESPDISETDTLSTVLQNLRSQPGGLDHIVMVCPPAPQEDGSQVQPLADAMGIAQSVLKLWQQHPPRLTAVTCGAQVAIPGDAGCPTGAALAGLFATLALEHPELNPRIIDLDVAEHTAIGLEELEADSPPRVARRGGERLSPRLTRMPTARRGMVRLDRTGENTASAVALSPIPARSLKPGEVRLEMRASGVNFRDVLSTLNMYPGDPVALGNEGTGIVIEVGPDVAKLVPGQRVVGLVPWSHGSQAIAPASVVVPVPDDLSDVQAAATPVAFLTAAYGLFDLADLKPGQSVLIHAAAGGVGLAAAKLALRHGAKVFATAGSKRKRAYLREMGIAHVFSSRDTEFSRHIMDLTDGHGVDVVLNALSGEFIPASLNLVATGGSFLELGKRDVLTPEEVQALRQDISYRIYDLGEKALEDDGLVRRLITPVFKAFRDHSLDLLPVRQFDLSDAGAAFRYMAQARHIGKIVLTSNCPAFSVDPDASYWITGGTGAIGLDAARWLIEQGARKLVLSSRSGAGANTDRITELRATGADIIVAQADAADPKAMHEVLETAQRLGPLKGVIHAAGTLRDAAFMQQTADDIATVFGAKVIGAHILDALTAPLNLDFFLTFSGAGLVLGAPGQAAYSAANAALDALMRRRRALGLPATCMSLGPWAGAGMAENLRESGRDPWGDRGVSPIEPTDGFAVAERLIASGTPWSMVADIDWTRFAATGPDALHRAYFEALSTTKVSQQTPDRPSGTDAGLNQLRALPQQDRFDALLALLAGFARTTIGLTSSTEIPARMALRDIGLDSLMAVEFRNTLVRVGATPLPVTLLFDHPTLHRLTLKLAEIWGIEIAADPADPVPEPESDSTGVDHLSDDEALALLQAELNPGQQP